LIRENNQLHLELIKGEDEAGKQQQMFEMDKTQLLAQIREAEVRGDCE